MKKRAITEEALFRAIGDIDDKLVSEALDYKPKRRRIPPFVSVMSTVAAALLVLLLVVSLLPGLLDGSGDAPADTGGSEPPSAPVWTVAEGHTENLALLSCLDDVKERAESGTKAPTLTDGHARIIFRDERDGIYYEVPLGGASNAELERLVALLRSPDKEAPVPAGSESPPFSLWVTLGDGVAVSPYLDYGSGNLFYGTLDSYVPEYLPSESLAAFLCELLRENAD